MKILPSTNITIPKSLVVIKDTTKGILVPIPYRHIHGANTLILIGSLTRLVVLRGNLMPITPGLNPVPDHYLDSLTATIVIYYRAPHAVLL